MSYPVTVDALRQFAENFVNQEPGLCFGNRW